MLELLFLLLPIAAAYGWYMGQRSVLQNKQQEAYKISREYVDGLDFLLSNQQDKAVNHFVDMLKEDSGTFEAHITLGNLFRSRGEVDKAIRVHQSLMESTSFSFDQRLLAIQELGRDYLAAGLYDRAEEMFNQLLNEDDFQLNALQQLLMIYQSTSDWSKAIDIAERLVKLGKKEFKQYISQYYCELALQSMGVDDLDKAEPILKKALNVDPHCARASIILGRIWIARHKDKQAITVLKYVLEQDKDFISEALIILRDCFQRLNKSDEWMAFLKTCLSTCDCSVAELMMADMLEKYEGNETAQLFVNRQLQRHPSMPLFHRLINYHLAEAENGRAKESLILLRDIVEKQIKIKPRYRCEKCGFTSHSLYWLCPSCRSWATIKLIRGVEGSN